MMVDGAGTTAGRKRAADGTGEVVSADPLEVVGVVVGDGAVPSWLCEESGRVESSRVAQAAKALCESRLQKSLVCRRRESDKSLFLQDLCRATAQTLAIFNECQSGCGPQSVWRRRVYLMFTPQMCFVENTRFQAEGMTIALEIH